MFEQFAMLVAIALIASLTAVGAITLLAVLRIIPGWPDEDRLRRLDHAFYELEMLFMGDIISDTARLNQAKDIVSRVQIKRPT